MAAAPDLTGRRFGRLTVLRRVENHMTGETRARSRWLCRCDCGGTRMVLGQNLQRSKGATVSCGCKTREVIMSNMHRMHAARAATLARRREERLAGKVKVAKTTEVRDDYRVRATRREKEAQSAAADLARALGYLTGGK